MMNLIIFIINRNRNPKQTCNQIIKWFIVYQSNRCRRIANSIEIP